jgi:hypothetical protein
MMISFAARSFLTCACNGLDSSEGEDEKTPAPGRGERLIPDTRGATLVRRLFTLYVSL